MAGHCSRYVFIVCVSSVHFTHCCMCALGWIKCRAEILSSYYTWQRHSGRTLANSSLFFLHEDPGTTQNHERGNVKRYVQEYNELLSKTEEKNPVHYCTLSESTKICFQFLCLKHMLKCQDFLKIGSHQQRCNLPFF